MKICKTADEVMKILCDSLEKSAVGPISAVDPLPGLAETSSGRILKRKCASLVDRICEKVSTGTKSLYLLLFIWRLALSFSELDFSLNIVTTLGRRPRIDVNRYGLP